MRIIFLTRQSDICTLFLSYLEKHTCLVFTNSDICFNMIKSMEPKADLLVLDYTLFNHDIFSMINYMNNEYPYLPYIYYNEPCMILSERLAHWKYFIEIQNKYDLQKPSSEYTEILKRIDLCIKEEKLEDYIYLLQKPKYFSKKNLVEKGHLSDQEIIESHLDKMKKEKLITKRQHFLAKCLITNSSQASISLEDIIHIYNKNELIIKKESLKVKISELKNIFETTEGCPLSIIKRKDKYQVIYL